VFECSSKIQRYSPTDSAKAFEKPVNRKIGVRFNPKQALDIVRSDVVRRSAELEPSEQEKRALIESYLDVSFSFVQSS
jgi:cohesin loading factor subunit SCC2